MNRETDRSTRLRRSMRQRFGFNFYDVFVVAFCVGFAVVCFYPMSVSYTHLDVYKRQGTGTCPAMRGGRRLRGARCETWERPCRRPLPARCPW